jgi:hypothetical protein
LGHALKYSSPKASSLDDCAPAISSSDSIKYVVRLLNGQEADIEILQFIKALISHCIGTLSFIYQWFGVDGNSR